MNTSLQSVRIAVAGGGTAGYTVAILLAQAGARVDLFEARTSRDLGSGIMLQANALRVLRTAGVLLPVLAAGSGFASTGVRVPDANSTLVGEVPGARLEPDLPSAIGISRPQLAEVLDRRALEVGVSVHGGVSVIALADGEDDIELGLQSGAGPQTARFDLLVAADGLNSTIRTLIGIQVTPRPMALGVWRVLTRRPAGVDRAEVINGGAAYFAGFAPINETQMYAWLVDDYADRRTWSVADQLGYFHRLASTYHGPWDEIRSMLEPDTPIGYTRYSEILVPPPWHRGRTVVIGDAVHACPPTLAQGAAQALEDALVLADVLTAAGAMNDEALTSFAARRYPRAEVVVRASVQMADWQLRHEQGDVPGLMGRVNAILVAPA